MGLLSIRTSGSFGIQVDREFSALKSGHAVAVDDAIIFLTEYREKMRRQDNQQRADGDNPLDHFAEADKRGLLNP